MPNAVKVEKIIRVLHQMGFTELRQKESHKFFAHADGRTTVIPFHKEIRIKLLTRIIKHDLKMEREVFFKLIE